MLRSAGSIWGSQRAISSAFPEMHGGHYAYKCVIAGAFRRCFARISATALFEIFELSTGKVLPIRREYIHMLLSDLIVGVEYS